MDLMGGIFSQIGNWVHDWATSAWKQDKAEGMQDHAQNFASAQQLQAQDFSERMFNNRYSKTVNDLIASGLNPMLAYGQGGGHQPSSSAASAGSASAPPMTSSGSSLAASMQSAAQANLLDAQTDKVKAETRILTDEFGEPDESGSRTPKAVSNRLKAFQGTAAWYEAQNKMRQANLTDAETDRVRQHIVNLATENRLAELDIPKAINMAKAQQDWYFEKIAPYTGELGKFSNSAADIARARRGFRNY